MRFFFCLLCFNFFSALAQEKPILYALPGQGSDCRLFDLLELQSHFDFRCIKLTTPEEAWTMEEYAMSLSEQIDTSKDFHLLGVSIGGMLACEIADQLHPQSLIIISSASSKFDLPRRYTMLQKFPIYEIVPGQVSKLGAYVLQPIVEYDRNDQKELFRAMLKDKDPLFLKRTIPMIINWEREISPKELVQIHGERDRTLPLRHLEPDYIISDGSHMLTSTKAALLKQLILDVYQMP